MASSYENNCRWALDRIEPYLDDDLENEELSRFEEHIGDCETCAEELAFATRVVGELRSLPAHSAPEGVIPGQEWEAPSLAERFSGWFAERWAVAMRPAMVTMVVMIVAVGAFVISQRDRLPGNGASDVEQAQVEAAAEQAMVAFAYIGKYSRRAGYIVRDELDENVVGRVEDAMGQSMRETVKQTRILETIQRARRSDT
jgi:predicted anti-sigma-YlaC factor YlaD